jgi:hypothetical protein
MYIPVRLLFSQFNLPLKTTPLKVHFPLIPSRSLACIMLPLASQPLLLPRINYNFPQSLCAWNGAHLTASHSSTTSLLLPVHSDNRSRYSVSLFQLLLGHEDGINKFFRSVSRHIPDYKVSYSRTLYC